MTPDRLHALLECFPSRRIAVVGDFFLDKYLDVDPGLAETSLETGKIAHQVVGIRTAPGAAGTVVNNLAALDAGTLYAIGAVGEDGEGYDLRRELERRGCQTGGLLTCAELMTPTYLKPRDASTADLSGEHSRYDTRNRRTTPDAVTDRVLAALDGVLPKVDAVIIADQVVEDNCGIITARFREGLIERAARFPQTMFWVDSRSHVRQFRGMLLKPNQYEALGQYGAANDDFDLEDLLIALAGLAESANATVFLTRGEAGMLVSGNEPMMVPGVSVEGPVDPTGAGDSATAGCVLALSAGASPTEAALVGNLVASITVQQLATTGTARREELPPRLDLWRSQYGG